MPDLVGVNLSQAFGTKWLRERWELIQQAQEQLAQWHQPVGSDYDDDQLSIYEQCKSYVSKSSLASSSSNGIRCECILYLVVTGMKLDYLEPLLAEVLDTYPFCSWGL